MLFQVIVAMGRLVLNDVSWLTSDVRSLMTSLGLKNLDHLDVKPTCKLRQNTPSASSTSRIKVDRISIGASLSINTLVALLSHIDVIYLTFFNICRVLDLPINSPPPSQVRSTNTVISHTKHLFKRKQKL